MESHIVTANNLKKFYPITRGLVFRKTVGWIKPVDDVSFSIRKGGTLSLVGESGAGKTTVAKLLLMMEKLTSGTIYFNGRDIYKASRSDLRGYRSHIQAVFQDPWDSLNPRMRVRDIVSEPLIVNNAGRASRAGINTRLLKVLAQVGLRSDQAELYPHEFSGGQRQRIAIARAIALNPMLIVLDEPVSALDVSIRAQIMNLLKDLQEQNNVSYLLIAHNLSTVRFMSDTIMVMYLGQIVEYSEVEALFINPLHPYTKLLIYASLPMHPDDKTEERVIKGEISSAVHIPSGCRFHPRCEEAMPICAQVEPLLKTFSPSHMVRCHLY